MNAVWHRIMLGWERLLERLRSIVDLDPFRKEREASNEYERQRQEWRRRLDEAANVVLAMPALPGGGAEAQARRQMAALRAAVGPVLRDPGNPVAVRFFLDHYRKELRTMMPRQRGESPGAYAARQESAIKDVMRDYTDEDVPLSEFLGYLEMPPRASWNLVIGELVSWNNGLVLAGLVILGLFFFLSALSGWVNDLGKSLTHMERIGNLSWAWLLYLIVSVPYLTWHFWRSFREAGLTDESQKKVTRRYLR